MLYISEVQIVKMYPKIVIFNVRRPVLILIYYVKKTSLNASLRYNGEINKINSNLTKYKSKARYFHN